MMPMNKLLERRSRLLLESTIIRKQDALHIAIINRTFGYLFGGGEMYDLNTANYLHSQGHRVTLFCGRPIFRKMSNQYLSDRRVTPLVPDLRTLAYRLPRGGGYLRYLDHALFCSRIAPFVLRAQPDIIQVCSIPIAYRIARKFSKKHKLAIVLIQHGAPNLYFREEYQNYDAVVAVGDAYEAHRGLIDPKRLFRVDPGIDTDHFRPGDKEKAKESLGLSDRNVLLFVGRLIPGKGLLRLLRVIDIVRVSNPKIICLIAGGGPLQNVVNKEIIRRQLSSHIQILGCVPNEMLTTIYNASDIFVSCSEYESIPITIMEAMSCGLPVVATKTGGIPLLVRSEENGCLIPEGSGYEQKFSECIISILNSAQTSSMMNANRKLAVNHFNVQIQGSSLQAIFKKCLEDVK
jgi:glycosyltransferase involved in cell wall biosynthesis